MTSLAIKHRPKTIADLKGQDAIERILSSAIKNDRISSAYVLTGIRGVGKTTTARIIARSINCEQGPTLTPCGTCSSCRAIETDSSLDVTEIDAASNTGVDQMRDLIAGVSYAPMASGSRKIYIIDEVHMLSTSAFNALLKTLEEPPAHAMFILATTELQKVPVTVLSRCQVLSLARISISEIRDNLERISGIEGVSLEKGVSGLIARAAGGSMRDAISMLDQSISGSEGEVKLNDVAQMIGRASRLKTGALTRLIAEGKLAEALTSWSSIIANGADPFSAIEDVTEWLHQANVFSLAPKYFESSETPEAEVAYLSAISKSTKQQALSGAVTMMMEVTPNLRHAPNGLQGCEMAITRLTTTFSRVNNG